MRKQEGGGGNTWETNGQRRETRGKEMNGNGPCEKNGGQRDAERRNKRKERKRERRRNEKKREKARRLLMSAPESEARRRFFRRERLHFAAVLLFLGSEKHCDPLPVVRV